jgi:hypothetical protein
VCATQTRIHRPHFADGVGGAGALLKIASRHGIHHGLHGGGTGARPVVAGKSRRLTVAVTALGFGSGAPTPTGDEALQRSGHAHRHPNDASASKVTSQRTMSRQGIRASRADHVPATSTSTSRTCAGSCRTPSPRWRSAEARECGRGGELRSPALCWTWHPGAASSNVTIQWHGHGEP